MDVAKQKTHDGIFVLGLAEESHSADGFQLLGAIVGEFLFVLFDVVHPQTGEIIESLCQAMCGDIVGGSGLEFERQGGKRGFLEGHRLNHLAPTLVRWQAIEPLFLAIKHANARRSVGFVAAEGEEVAV